MTWISSIRGGNAFYDTQLTADFDKYEKKYMKKETRIKSTKKCKYIEKTTISLLCIVQNQYGD